VRKLFSIFIVLAILTPEITKSVVFLNFLSSKKYIAKEICVQRKIKNNCCKGSCHLSKELKKVETPQEKKAPSRDVKTSEINLFFCVKGENSSTIYEKQLKNNFSHFSSFYILEDNTDIFHPPQVI